MATFLNPGNELHKIPTRMCFGKEPQAIERQTLSCYTIPGASMPTRPI